VRKAAIQILSGIQWTEKEALNAGVLDDPDPNTKLAAILSLTKVAPSEALGKKLFALSNDKAVKADTWLAKAVYIAATRHRSGFTQSFFKANPGFTAAEKESQRESQTYDDSAWKEMKLPQAIEDAGLDIDG